MKLRGVMWIVRVVAVSAMLTVGVANAGPVVNPGYELYETLSGTTFGGVAFQGVPIALSDTLRGTSQGVPWNHFPPTAALEITGVNEFLNGTNSNADFFPFGPFQNVLPTGAVHRMSVTTVPEPGSLSLLAIGVLAGVGRQLLSRRRAV